MAEGANHEVQEALDEVWRTVRADVDLERRFNALVREKRDLEVLIQGVIADRSHIEKQRIAALDALEAAVRNTESVTNFTR